MKPYKFIFLSFLLSINVLNLFAQSLSYTYDAAGNRVGRTVIPLPRPVASVNGKPEIRIYKDSTALFKMTVYPNPTHGDLKVQLDGKEEGLTYKLNLYNNVGVIVAKQEGADNSFILDLSSEPKGIYLLRIYCNEEIQEWKIIRE